jgi:hypothetical protein
MWREIFKTGLFNSDAQQRRGSYRERMPDVSDCAKLLDIAGEGGLGQTVFLTLLPRHVHF